jgi:hypothetical protein
MELKICSKCNLEKLINEFSTRKLKKGDITTRNECKECRCKIEKERRENNKDKFKEKDKKYYVSNKETILEKNKNYRVRNREKICDNKKKYYKKNRIIILQYHDNRKPIRNKVKQAKRISCIKTRIIENLRSSISMSLKHSKNDKFIKLLGCTKEYFLEWLELHFDDNMTWSNYASYWQIDHIIPVSFFNFTSEHEQYICFHWTNLRPLFKTSNIIKSNKILKFDILEHIKIIKTYIDNERYQANYENDWWRRLELRYGNNPNDDVEFKDLLKSIIRNEDIILFDNIIANISKLKISDDKI